MTSTHQAQPRLLEAVQWLESMQPQMLEELVKLCNINSFSDNLSGLHQTSDHLQDLMQDLGRPCQLHALPERPWIDDIGRKHGQATGPALQWSSDRFSFSDRASLQAHREANDPVRVLLAIHYDTVYPPDHPLQVCRPIGDDRLQGPGVIDAKGGIIVLRWAMLAAIKFGLLGNLTWSIVLNPDEEVGSPSSTHLWEKLASDFDFGMLYEPAMADNSLVDSRKGTGNFQWLVGGRSAHSGRNFEAGRNAIVHASELAMALHALNGVRSGVTINVGRIQGGGPLNVVPDLCSVRANVRVEEMSQLVWVEEQIETITRRFHDESRGFRCQREGGLTSPPKILDISTNLWKGEVQRAAETVGQTIAWKGSGGASDGNKLAALGLPNIDTFGPEGDGLHSPQEWIRISSLPKKSALSLAMLHRLATNPKPITSSEGPSP